MGSDITAPATDPSPIIRPSWPETWMKIARVVAERSYDPRMKVGAIVVSQDNTQMLAGGYNGNYAGGPHEQESPVPGQSGFIHAEVNALLKLDYNIAKGRSTMYITLSPCRMCAKYIINAGIRHVVYEEAYRDTSGVELLKKAGVEAVTLECAVWLEARKKDMTEMLQIAPPGHLIARLSRRSGWVSCSRSETLGFVAVIVGGDPAYYNPATTVAVYLIPSGLRLYPDELLAVADTVGGYGARIAYSQILPLHGSECDDKLLRFLVDVARLAEISHRRRIWSLDAADMARQHADAQEARHGRPLRCEWPSEAYYANLGWYDKYASQTPEERDRALRSAEDKRARKAEKRSRERQKA